MRRMAWVIGLAVSFVAPGSVGTLHGATADQPGPRTLTSGGPDFCRDGRGHPVHGREWCRERGWAPDLTYGWAPGGRSTVRPSRRVCRWDPTLGRSVCRTHRARGSAPPPSRWREPSWIEARWGDLVLRPGRSFRPGRTLSPGRLEDVVGRWVYDRLAEHAWEMGLDDRLSGLWHAAGRRGTMLEVRSRGFVVAELHDFGADGRVDVVLLRRR